MRIAGGLSIANTAADPDGDYSVSFTLTAVGDYSVQMTVGGNGSWYGVPPDAASALEWSALVSVATSTSRTSAARSMHDASTIAVQSVLQVSV